MKKLKIFYYEIMPYFFKRSLYDKEDPDVNASNLA